MAIEALILAANRNVFDQFLRVGGLDRKSYRYVHASDSLYGMRGANLWVVNTAWQRTDYHEIIDMARALGMTITNKRY